MDLPHVDMYALEQVIDALVGMGAVVLTGMPLDTEMSLAAVLRAHEDITDVPDDPRTMFPKKLSYAPTPERAVIQVYEDPNRGEAEPFRTLVRPMMASMADLSTALLHTLAERYGWEKSTRADVVRRDEWVLNGVHYFFTEGGNGQVLFPPHRDWGLLTLYPAVGGPGLELNFGKGWEAVDTSDGILLYAGNIIQRLVPDIQSVLHRVVQTGEDSKGRTALIYYVDGYRPLQLPTGETVGEYIDKSLRRLGQI